MHINSCTLLSADAGPPSQDQRRLCILYTVGPLQHPLEEFLADNGFAQWVCSLLVPVVSSVLHPDKLNVNNACNSTAGMKLFLLLRSCQSVRLALGWLFLPCEGCSFPVNNIHA